MSFYCHLEIRGRLLNSEKDSKQEMLLIQKLTKEILAAVTYRVTAELAKLKISQQEDLFGPTMNLCAKINSKAPANVMVIGRDLYLVLLLLHLPRSYKVIIDSLPVFCTTL